MKNDRQTYMLQCSPSEWLPLARGDIGSESIAQLTYHCEQRRCLRTRNNPKDLMKDWFDKKRFATTDCRGSTPPSMLEGPKDSPLARSLLVRRLFGRTPDRQWWRGSSPPLGKPPTGFSEPDVGKPPDIECDVGRRLDELLSSELETTRLTDDEVRNDRCLTMDSKGFQLCQN